MRRKYMLLQVLCIGTFCSTRAQDASDLLRYSQSNITGSARVAGAGGAWGSVGADLSSLSLNPAGLGFYRRNEVMAGMAISSNRSDASYLGSTFDDSRVNFNLPNLGFVYTRVMQEKGRDATSGLVSWSAGGGLNRTSSFQQNLSFGGISTNSSLTDYYAQAGKNVNPTSFDNSYKNDPGNIGYQLYLTDYDYVKGRYLSHFDRNGGDSMYSVKQSQQSNLRGRMLDWNIAAGVNISNTVYFGASLFFTDVQYENTTTLNESLVSKSKPDSINQYVAGSINYSIQSSGSGVGGRFGAILAPVDYLRVGIAYQTAVRINMRDDYSFGGSSVMRDTLNFQETISRTYSSPNKDYYEYQVITPGKIIMSASAIHPKYGLLSVDYEMVDYSSAKLSPASVFQSGNDTSKLRFATASNIRVGSEFRYDNYRFRLGYALYGSPLKDSRFDMSRQSYTAGVGLVMDNGLFFDVAVVNTRGKEYVAPYVLTDPSKINSVAENEFSTYNFILSAGFRF